jgi:predicted ATPase
MQLCAALGVSLMQTKGPAPDTIAAWDTALEIAERLADSEYQLRSLWGLWHFRVSRGECRPALDLARRFSDRVARLDHPADRPVGERMVGTSLHYLGEQAEARRHLEAMLGHYVDSTRRSHMIRFQYDQPLVARMILARILWLQGFPDQGLRLARGNVVDAQAIGHAVSLCGALEVSSLLEIWSGELEDAERSVAMLLDSSGRSALSVWHARGRCLRGVVLVRRGDVAAGSAVLRSGLDELRATDFVPYYTGLLGTMAQALVGVGQIPQGLATIDEALARDERDQEFWCVAELLRIKAELLLLAGGPDAPATAEEHFQRALDWTRRQGVLSMELRCAVGLARLWHGQGRTAAARDLLTPVYARFTEGFATPELQAARALLDRLA